MIPVSKLYNPVKACLHEDYKALNLQKHKKTAAYPVCPGLPQSLC